jgi:hypothetical protein
MRHRTEQNNPADLKSSVVQSEAQIRRKKSDLDASFEREIIPGMILSDEYLERVRPLVKFLRADFARTIGQWCAEYFEEYSKAPKDSIRKIFEDNEKLFSEDQAELVKEFLSDLDDEFKRREEFKFDLEFMLDKTSEYFQECIGLTLENDLHRCKGEEQRLDAQIKWQEASMEINRATGQDIEQEVKPITAKELETMNIPKPKWVIENVLPEGLSILGGKPKKGKSLLALNIALSVTAGIPTLGNLPSKTGPVIYLAFEDTQARLQDRIGKILRRPDFPKELWLHPQKSFPQMPQGLTILESEIEQYSPRLIVIDTWGRFKPSSQGRRPDSTGGYDIGVEEMSQLKDLGDGYGVDILVLHHMRKGGSDDIIESFLGTIANVATADNALGLVRMGQNPEATLHVEGRDIESQDIAIKLNYPIWENMGPAAEVQSTAIRQAIIDAILNNEGPMTPKAIKDAIGLEVKLNYFHVTLPRMVGQGLLVKDDRGKYDVPIDTRLRWRVNQEKVVPMRRRRGNGEND